MRLKIFVRAKKASKREPIAASYVAITTFVFDKYIHRPSCNTCTLSEEGKPQKKWYEDSDSDEIGEADVRAPATLA